MLQRQVEELQFELAAAKGGSFSGGVGGTDDSSVLPSAEAENHLNQSTNSNHTHTNLSNIGTKACVSLYNVSVNGSNVLHNSSVNSANGAANFSRCSSADRTGVNGSRLDGDSILHDDSTLGGSFGNLGGTFDVNHEVNNEECVASADMILVQAEAALQHLAVRDLELDRYVRAYIYIHIYHYISELLCVCVCIYIYIYIYI